MSSKYKITKENDGFYTVWMRHTFSSEYQYIWSYGDCDRAIAMCERLIDRDSGETVTVDLRGVAHA
jgi:hypothetical protein